jgi:hypothetical protein
MRLEIAMNCEQFRERIGVDPAHSRPSAQAHELECPACAAYAKRARKAEALIHLALRFDRLTVARRPSRQPAWGSLAAVIVAGIAFWFGLSVDRPAPTGELIAEVLAHWDHEPGALAFSATGVPARQLAQVLAGEATIDLAALDLAAMGPVTYANKCAVAGQWMSHLVVQSGNGPVTVLLIPEQSVEEIVPLEFAERGLEGSLFPAGAGAIAVLGERNAANPEVARQIAESVDIST